MHIPVLGFVRPRRYFRHFAGHAKKILFQSFSPDDEIRSNCETRLIHRVCRIVGRLEFDDFHRPFGGRPEKGNTPEGVSALCNINSKHLFGLLGIRRDLRLQRVEGGKLLLRPDPANERHFDRLAVKIFGKIEQIGLEQR